MTSIITGNIADFPEQLKSILEKTVKYERFITIRDNSYEKQLTISISAGISNDVDIYNVVRDGVLYMYIFHHRQLEVLLNIQHLIMQIELYT